MNAQDLENSYNYILSLIAEYENKHDKPTLDGFSSYLERQKQLQIRRYNERKAMRNDKL